MLLYVGKCGKITATEYTLASVFTFNVSEVTKKTLFGAKSFYT